MPSSHYFSPQTPFLDDSYLKSSRSISVHVRGAALHFLTGAGVFSKKSLDEGTRLLIEAIELPSESLFCDLGCGWGAVGAFMAAAFPDSRIWACDINPRAAQLTKWNHRANHLPEALVWCGNGLSAIQDEAFDAIACNPPIRAGNAVISTLFDDSYRALKKGGALWVVIRTSQGAKSWQKRLQLQFGECQSLQIKHGYRILRAVK